MKLSFAVFSLAQAGIGVGVKSYVGYENPYDLIILLIPLCRWAIGHAYLRPPSLHVNLSRALPSNGLLY